MPEQIIQTGEQEQGKCVIVPVQTDRQESVCQESVCQSPHMANMHTVRLIERDKRQVYTDHVRA
jgi:hypothetical protein